MDQDPTHSPAGPDGTSTLDLSGRCVGSSYLLVRPIGQGATGTVWRGVDRSTGEPVAVKLLHESLLRQPKLVTRFVQERTILLMLRHRNVVRVRDLFSVGESLGLVMDLVEGGSMRDHLREHHTVPPGEAARLAAQVAAALAEAHERGVIHRDLKPDNVLLRMQDGRLDTRLTDFGIARILNTPSLTTTHAVVGTPHYMAPEAFHGAPASAAADVYALGVLLYELVVGRPPYESDCVADLLGMHLNDTPERVPGIPDGLWELIMACMAKKPRLRPSAAELVADLGDVALATADVPALPKSATRTAVAALPDRRAPHVVPPPAVRSAVEHPSLDGVVPRIPPRRNQVPHWRWARPGAIVVLVCGAMVVSGLATSAWHLNHRTDPPAIGAQALAPVDVTAVATRKPARPPRIVSSVRTASTAAPSTRDPAPSPSTKDRVTPPSTQDAVADRQDAADRSARRRPSPSPVAARPTTKPVEEAKPYGPWVCDEGSPWWSPVTIQPCYAVGPAVRVKGILGARPGGAASVTVSLRDVETDRTFVTYDCADLRFGRDGGTRTCGPTSVRPARGARYVVVVDWTYTRHGRTAHRTATGEPFDW